MGALPWYREMSLASTSGTSLDVWINAWGSVSDLQVCLGFRCSKKVEKHCIRPKVNMSHCYLDKTGKGKWLYGKANMNSTRSSRLETEISLNLSKWCCRAVLGTSRFVHDGCKYSAISFHCHSVASGEWYLAGERLVESHGGYCCTERDSKSWKQRPGHNHRPASEWYQPTSQATHRPRLTAQGGLHFLRTLLVLSVSLFLCRSNGIWTIENWLQFILFNFLQEQQMCDAWFSIAP